MVQLKQTEIFRKWRLRLKDLRARAIIAARLDRLAFGNAGDVKPLGNGISELRIDFGPGYRVYVTRRGRELVILLAGGDKSSQVKDMATAKRLAEKWRDEHA